jgi:hypothetical protein
MPAGTALWSLAGQGELEVLNLRLLHSGSSKGAFISVSDGVVIINCSTITSEASGCVLGMRTM